MAHALVIVDVQHDFQEGGSLAVDGGKQIAKDIRKHVENFGDDLYSYVVTTQDWHINPKGRFAAEGEEPNFSTTWPVHCVANSHGALLDENIDSLVDIDARFFKGEWTAAYSGFEAYFEDVLIGSTSLHHWLDNHGVTDITVVGLAADFCVKATVLDGLKLGYNVVVLDNLTAAVGDKEQALDEMHDAGAITLTAQLEEN